MTRFLLAIASKRFLINPWRGKSPVIGGFLLPFFSEGNDENRELKTGH